MSLALFSVGYATKPPDAFLEQLGQYNVDVIADIRSVPYSSAFHDYAREPLQRILTANELHYVYLGKELGPRSHDPEHYDETGQVQFDRLRRGPIFSRYSAITQWPQQRTQDCADVRRKRCRILPPQPVSRPSPAA